MNFSLDKTKSVEIKQKRYQFFSFSQNQLNLLLKKKQRVRWTRDEMAKLLH
jgi:hypothetical protein